jgi:hypothetical protein
MTGNFNQGRSVGEREGVPAYGDANEAYRVNGDMDKYVGDFPQGSDRNQPIRGRCTMAPIPGCHGGSQVMDGTGVVTSPTNRELMGNSLERLAANACVGQFVHAQTIAMQRPEGKRDFPDGTGRATGRIKAVHQFGLGPNVAIAADLGHDPIDTPIDHDYRRQPEGPVPSALDKYVGAAGVLAQPVGNASGFPRDHERSQFVTMGETAVEGIVARSELIATSRIPTTKPAAPRSNRILGQQRKAR